MAKDTFDPEVARQLTAEIVELCRLDGRYLAAAVQGVTIGTEVAVQTSIRRERAALNALVSALAIAGPKHMTPGVKKMMYDQIEGFYEGWKREHMCETEREFLDDAKTKHD